VLVFAAAELAAVVAQHGLDPRAMLFEVGSQLLRHTHGAVARVCQGVLQNGLLDGLRHAIGMRVARAGQPIEQPVRAIGLEVAADLVELLAAVADYLLQALDTLPRSEASSSRLSLRRAIFCSVVMWLSAEGLMLLATPS
jgi:hypothetical protein